MEVQIRRHRANQDQENVYVGKGKTNIAVPAKKQGLTVRGALGDINTNVQVQRDINVGKVAEATAEFEKKALNKGAVKTNYRNVQSKVDTGRTSKNTIQPSSRPPLRREESTASLAAKAAARTKAAQKDTQKKPTEIKESINIYIQTKKTESKKINKFPSIKENKEVKPLKPILKESTESLGKLKLRDEMKSLLKHPANSKKVIEESPKLPQDIEDIDANDNNPFLMAVYIKDIYKYLTELEVKYPIEHDHLKKQSDITGKMRSTLIDWLVDVQRQFSLVLDTFHLTVGIIDRYLQEVPNVPRNQLQLVGVTAMFIASKYEEIYAPDVNDFIYVTDKAYTKADIFRCERNIMSKLGFCLARPIPLSFLRRFVKAAHGSSKNHQLAKYFVDLSIIEYSMAHYRPSELAAAAVCLSLHLLSKRDLKEAWTPTLTYYSGYNFDHLTPIIRKIAKIVVNAKSSKYQAVYKKYREASLAGVSELEEVKGNAIRQLAEETSL